MPNPRPIAERFLDKIQKTDGCWLWTGMLNDDGYGKLALCDGTARCVFAHRVAYEHFTGAIPDGLVVRHSCDVPRCVNPAHLLLGTQMDNIADCVERGRMHLGDRTATAKLNSSQVIALRRMYAAGVRVEEIAANFGIGNTAVSAIATGRHWRHLSGICVPRGLESNRAKKITLDQVRDIRIAYRIGTPLKDMAARFELNISYVSSVATGKYYPDLPGICPPRLIRKPRAA